MHHRLVGTTAASPARHDWFQSDTYVAVNVMIKNVKPEDATIIIEPESVRRTRADLLKPMFTSSAPTHRFATTAIACFVHS